MKPHGYILLTALTLLSQIDASTLFRNSKTLAVQICLDRAGFSPNTIDGQWGRKSDVALATYCAVKGIETPQTPLQAYNTLFSKEKDLFQVMIISQSDYDSLTPIPKTPLEKSKMSSMGYETIEEMYAERGHLSQAALRRLNPTLNWPNPPAGSKVTIPYFPPQDKKTIASILRISLSRFEITAFDENGTLIALFPCSIAKEKSKLPPKGEIYVTAYAPKPNYTYTEETGKKKKYIYPPGPNNPVGSSWISLSIPTYGIHGTPIPEKIGRAESHGCFRLANWNAIRLFELIDVGTPIVIE